MAQVKQYQAGDIITFPTQRPSHWNKKGEMDKYLGKSFTLRSVYQMVNGGLQRLFFEGGEFWLFLSTDLSPFNVGDEVVLVEPFKVFRILTDGRLDICDSEGNCISVEPNHVKIKQTDMKAMKDAVLKVATDLATAKNTVTTLEIKVELRRDYPYFFWTQDVVSKFMDQLAGDGVFTYTDNGTYRIYSLTTATPSGRVPAGFAAPLSKSLTTTVKASSANRAVAPSTYKVQKSKITWNKVLQLAGNPQFVAVTLANGTTITKDNIKAQKKSPLGYISPKQGRIKNINVGNTQYNVK